MSANSCADQCGATAEHSGNVETAAHGNEKKPAAHYALDNQLCTGCNLYGKPRYKRLPADSAYRVRSTKDEDSVGVETQPTACYSPFQHCGSILVPKQIIEEDSRITIRET